MFQLAGIVAMLLVSLLIIVPAPVPLPNTILITSEEHTTVSSDLKLTTFPTIPGGFIVEPVTEVSESIIIVTPELTPELSITSEPTPTASELPPPSPTVTPTHSVAPTPTVRPTPTLTPRPAPTATPTPTPTIAGTTLFDLVNKWRESTGRKPFKESDFACKVAQFRLPQVVKNFSHDGFNTLLKTVFTVNPNLHEIRENLADTPNPEAALNGWLNSPGHRVNLESNTPHMCIKNNGRIYVQIFTDL